MLQANARTYWLLNITRWFNSSIYYYDIVHSFINGTIASHREKVPDDLNVTDYFLPKAMVHSMHKSSDISGVELQKS